MLTVIVPLLSFIFLFCFFISQTNKTHFSQTAKIIIATILSLPALKLNSILFIFEVHFMIISIFIELIYKKITQTERRRHKGFCLCIALPFILSLGLMYFGFDNMNQILKTEYDIDTNKSLSKNYKIAMMADLHYPTSTNQNDLESLVERINDEQPDLIMLCGDIIDENTTPEERSEAFVTLGELSKASQVFYVYGNHDTGQFSYTNRISNQQLDSLIENNGIHVLNDEKIILNDEITIIGRKDYSLHERKAIKAYHPNNNTYNIVIDHQPKNLEECATQNIDLHLSGHTHAGQIFPLYYICELLNINELNYGRKDINQMSAINTSGVSGWGFPIRTEHHSEFVIVNIH